MPELTRLLISGEDEKIYEKTDRRHVAYYRAIYFSDSGSFLDDS